MMENGLVQDDKEKIIFHLFLEEVEKIFME